MKNDFNPTSQSALMAKADAVRQEYKERAIQEKAKQLDLNYVNLMQFPINPDLADILTAEESRVAHVAVYFKSGKKIKVATTNLDEVAQSVLTRLREKGYWVEVSLCSEESLEMVQKIYQTKEFIEPEGLEGEYSDAEIQASMKEVLSLKDLKDKIESSAFNLALEYIQNGAFRSRASDIHFEPDRDDVGVRFRIDGILHAVFRIQSEVFEGIAKEIKYASHIKLNITHLPQDGQYSFSVQKDHLINVRVSTLPTQHGEAIVMRLLDQNKQVSTIDQLGFSAQHVHQLKKVSTMDNGLVLVTGPTGSGKTTTLYALLKLIDTHKKKIITLEDPIEYSIKGVSQSQVHEKDKYYFSNGLRAILRQDPDVVMVGEVRDIETAEAATQASLTGHLVFSTLHTNSAIETIPRLINMGVRPFILSPSLNLIIAQRLVRRLCSCAQERVLTEKEADELKDRFEFLMKKGLLKAIPKKVKSATGCDQCGQTGYKGQLVIAENLVIDDKIRQMILNQVSMIEIKNYLKNEVMMLNLAEDGILKVIAGFTSLEEVSRVTEI